MQQHSRDVLKDVTTALQLEQELQLSLAQHGVTVLDVYSSEWGNTKALSETFRRLYTDAGDQIHLRFYSVECNSVLESLNFPEEQRNPQRPKNLDLCRETLPAFWEPILKGRRGKSKPYFVFYKEGRQRALIEGIDTPKIINCVRELCRIQKPANECTSNAELLKFWERYFSAAENEVFWESFVRAILDHTLSNQALTDREEKTFAEAIGVKDSSKVSLEELEKWIGENGTIDSAFAELFPFLKEEANISAVSGGGSRGITHLERADPEYNTSKDTAYGNAMEGRETLPEAGSKWRPELWHCVAVLPLHCPSKTRLVLLSTEKGEEEAKEYAQRAVEIPTLNAYLTDLGFTSEDIQVMCHSAAEKIPSLNLSYGKLAMTLVLSDSAKCDELLKHQEGLFEHLSGGTLMAQKPSLAYTLICLCTSDAQGHYETIYYSNDASTVECTSPLNEGDEVVLLPFSRLNTDTPTEGAFAVKFVGMPQVIPLPATADSKGEAVVLSPWYCKFHVTKREENGLTLTFAGFIEEEMFHQSVQSYTEHLMADEGKLAKSADVVGISERPLGTEHQSFILSITDPHLLDNHNTMIPPPHEESAEIPPPHEGSAEVPPPHEGSAEVPPPHEGSAEIPPPHEESAEIPPPHESPVSVPNDAKELSEDDVAKAEEREPLRDVAEI